MNAWRLVECPPVRGDWNMAVDAALMESVASRGACCLRFYAWSEPTVSLGYFQRWTDRQGHTASRACPLVRRSTGGGAIVHDRELTYSFVVPADHPLVSHAPALYLLFHETLIEALADWGVAAHMCGQESVQVAGPEPFLCFERRASADCLVRGAKVAGSAQRRRRGAVLQHGSILLGRSPAAPELPGLVELAGCDIPPDELTGAWRARLARRLKVVWQPEPLNGDERARSDRIVGETYGQRHGPSAGKLWPRGQNRPRRMPFGQTAVRQRRLPSIPGDIADRIGTPTDLGISAIF